MRIFRLLAALGLALASLVLVPATAFACSCAQMTVAQQVDNADVVVRGTIESADEPAVIRSSADPVVYTVVVAQTYKGQASGALEVRSAVSGASCGLENVRVGEEYVVFAYTGSENAHPDRLWANLCGGTAPATPALVSEVEAAVGPGPETPAPSVVPTDVAAGQAGEPVPAADTDGGGTWWPWAAGAAVAGLAGAAIARRLRRS